MGMKKINLRNMGENEHLGEGGENYGKVGISYRRKSH